MKVKLCTFAVIIFFVNTSCFSQIYFSSGLGYSTESFNLQNIKGSTTGSTYDNIQYNSSLFFGTVQLNNNFSKIFNKSSCISLDNFIRYNHHYYKRLTRKSGLEDHKNIPQVRKLKLDLFIDYIRRANLKKVNFVYGFGVGVNNINSGYNYTYNDTIREDPYLNGTAFNKTFKGNWLKFSPKILIGIEYKKYLISLDAMLTKDPTFKNLISTSLRLSVKRRLVKLF